MDEFLPDPDALILPDPFTAALAGGGVLGAVSRRRRAAERKAAEDVDARDSPS